MRYANVIMLYNPETLQRLRTNRQSDKMARIDDYINARKLAVDALANESLDTLIARSGFERSEDGSIQVPFLDRIYRVNPDGFDFNDSLAPEKEVPIQEQILVLHYLLASDPPGLSGDWVAYREIPGASFYNSAFIKRAIDPMKKVFGQDPDGFKTAAGRLNGKPIEPGDAGFEFEVFPKVPLQIILYAGDDEFPAEANILFDKSIEGILSPEDIAWMAGMQVYRLIALSRG